MTLNEIVNCTQKDSDNVRKGIGENVQLPIQLLMLPFPFANNDFQHRLMLGYKLLHRDRAATQANQTRYSVGMDNRTSTIV
jgi:hypothetical protein